MFHRVRVHTSIWKIKIKLIALCQNLPILLFFVANCWFFCFLDCDGWNVSCTWTTIGFVCLTIDYGSKICLCSSSRVRVSQVESILFSTLLKITEFIAFFQCLCEFLLFFLCFAIRIADYVVNHNTYQYPRYILFSSSKNNCISLYMWLFHLHAIATDVVATELEQVVQLPCRIITVSMKMTMWSWR